MQKYGSEGTSRPCGFIFGNANLSRQKLIADVFFIYVYPEFRGRGLSAVLFNSFEKEVRKRNFDACGKATVTILRIIMKACIEKSLNLWLKFGFSGTKESSILTKEVYIYEY